MTMIFKKSIFTELPPATKVGQEDSDGLRIGQDDLRGRQWACVTLR